MLFWHSVLLGVIEGITEFLPISSTAHLIITSDLLGIGNLEFTKTFEIIIQLGALLALAALYAKRLLKNPHDILLAIVGFIPTGIVGFLVYPLVKPYLLGNITIVAVTLFLGGVILLIVESRKPISAPEKTNLSYRDALIIGAVQSLAIVPGVSRSGATIVAGLLLGFSRRQALEFSFLLALPTMAAATLLELVKTPASVYSGHWGLIMTGFGLAFVAALASVKWLTNFVATHNFKGFGWYRIILGLAIGAALFFKL